MDAALEKRLDDQDHQIEILLKQTLQVMELLKGSELLNYPGVINTLKTITEHVGRIDSMVQHMERWRQVQIAKKGTFTFKTASLVTKGMAILGGISLVAGIIYTFLQIFEKIKL